MLYIYWEETSIMSMANILLEFLKIYTLQINGLIILDPGYNQHDNAKSLNGQKNDFAQFTEMKQIGI